MPLTFILQDDAEFQTQLLVFERFLGAYSLKILAQSSKSDGTVVLTVEKPAYPVLRMVRAAAEDCFGQSLISIEHS